MKPFNSRKFFNDDFFRETVSLSGEEYYAVFERDQEAAPDGKLRPAAGMGILHLRTADLARPAAGIDFVSGTETWTIQYAAQDGDCWRCNVKLKKRAAA